MSGSRDVGGRPGRTRGMTAWESGREGSRVPFPQVVGDVISYEREGRALELG